MTRAARERTYRVMMAALMEEIRISATSSDDILRRQREIHESCFGIAQERAR